MPCAVNVTAGRTVASMSKTESICRCVDCFWMLFFLALQQDDLVCRLKQRIWRLAVCAALCFNVASMCCLSDCIHHLMFVSLHLFCSDSLNTPRTVYVKMLLNGFTFREGTGSDLMTRSTVWLVFPWQLPVCLQRLAKVLLPVGPFHILTRCNYFMWHKHKADRYFEVKEKRVSGFLTCILYSALLSRGCRSAFHCCKPLEVCLFQMKLFQFFTK